MIPAGLWTAAALALAIGYLLGAIPTGYLAGRWFKGVDIREHGSGSTGATNALRTLGPGPAVGVITVDVLKGVAGVLLARWLVTSSPLASTPGADVQAWTPWIESGAALAALLGHSRSVWLTFTGGKSVATGLGVLLAMAWPVGLGGLAVFGVAVAIWHRVSLGSILASATAIGLVCVLQEPLAYRLLVIAGGLYVIVRHRANLQRLLAGTEPRLGAKPNAP